MNLEVDLASDLNLPEFTRELTICNKLGLHARAAARLVQLANDFQADIFLGKNDEMVKADSILSLLTLECPMGTNVIIRAQGNDASAAVEAIAQLVQDKFGEE